MCKLACNIAVLTQPGIPPTAKRKGRLGLQGGLHCTLHGLVGPWPGGHILPPPRAIAGFRKRPSSDWPAGGRAGKGLLRRSIHIPTDVALQLDEAQCALETEDNSLTMLFAWNRYSIACSMLERTPQCNIVSQCPEKTVSVPVLFAQMFWQLIIWMLFLV